MACCLGENEVSENQHNARVHNSTRNIHLAGRHFDLVDQGIIRSALDKSMVVVVESTDL